ncbi:MAG TPA: twin-arginine translocase subunit TatC [Micromonosporaceae bacterium]|nr:twin-arginine translocase subunit TatC [Micromonosporaceae bacterium]
MTLFEHLRELRGRLFKGSLGIAVGTIVGFFVAQRVINFLIAPYCQFQAGRTPGAACTFSAGGPLDTWLLTLKVALYVGLLLGAPIWLYQLWAFIAPGLHRHERRYTYIFAAIAAPLFAAGVVLAHLIVSKSLHFFLGAGNFNVVVGVNGYFGFVTKMMLLFGAGFEFPLLIVMLNLAGLASGKRLLGWWRQAIFLMFLFGAIVTPTPDPFGMSILATCMAILYFGAVAFALLNDRRRRRKTLYGDLSDDELSPLDEHDEIAAGEPIAAPEPVAPAQPIERRYDDFT